MKQEEILENNKLISEFMGITNVEEFNNSLCASHPEEGIWYYEPLWYLDYHSDWSLLMPVVEKIEKDLSIATMMYVNTWDNRGRYMFTFYKELDTDGSIRNQLFKESVSGSKIESIYNGVVEFIKWYNTPNQDTKNK